MTLSFILAYSSSSESRVGRPNFDAQPLNMQCHKSCIVFIKAACLQAARILLCSALFSLPAHGQNALDCGSGVSLRLSSSQVSQGGLVQAVVKSASPLTEWKAQWIDRAVPFWPDDLAPNVYRAFLGVDLEQKPGTYDLALTAQMQDGGQIACAAHVTISEGRFAVESLKVAPEFVEPNPKDLERANQEGQRLRDLYATETHERLWRGSFRLPLGRASARNAHNFGRRRVLNGEPRSPHTGVDFPAPAGTIVHAAQRGRVVIAENLFFSGNTVVLDHGLGVYTFYGHLESIAVKEGDLASPGEILGRVGATGRATGPHLHWGLTVNDARVNALQVVALTSRARSNVPARTISK
jgi:murein DD-endopeptidase MepM/ murein hydrolase activator NlpD